MIAMMHEAAGMQQEDGTFWTVSFKRWFSSRRCLFSSVRSWTRFAILSLSLLFSAVRVAFVLVRPGTMLALHIHIQFVCGKCGKWHL